MITPWQFNTHVPRRAGPQPRGRASASMWKRFSTQLNVQYRQYGGPGARSNSVVLGIEASCGLTQFAPPLGAGNTHTSPWRTNSSGLAFGSTFTAFRVKAKIKQIQRHTQKDRHLSRSQVLLPKILHLQRENSIQKAVMKWERENLI